MLTGTTLLTLVDEMQAQEPPAKMSEIVRACGYEIEGKLKYTEFYTELLTVKGLINNDVLEENEISEEYQEVYQTLCESYGKDAVNAFLEIYDDESNLQYFEDAYQGRYDSESDFAEQFTTDVYGFDAPSFVVVDWDATWNCNLRYDFDFEDGFVFSKNF
jgi:antirestriction protein